MIDSLALIQVALGYDNQLFGPSVTSRMLESSRTPCGVEVYMTMLMSTSGTAASVAITTLKTKTVQPT